MRPAIRRKLSLVSAEPNAEISNIEVWVELALSPETREPARLDARFEVKGASPHANGTLPRTSSQWGLWQWDVVELFVSANGREKGLASRPAYHEFQVSPLDQFFELEIFEPRVSVNRDFVSGFAHSATVTGSQAWRASMRIPLEKLGWTGRPADLIGGAFAILGEPGSRSYWALSVPPQDKPDFHLPEHFISFFGT